MLQTNFTNTTNFADTRSGMDDIQDFNTRIGNSVNNQMCIEDDKVQKIKKQKIIVFLCLTI